MRQRVCGHLQVDAPSRLRVPLKRVGPLEPAEAESVIRATPAINLARTAIADSLALVAQDLAELEPPRMVVLVTDGDETCDGDVPAEIQRIAASGIDLRLTIVGFSIDDAELAPTFEGWAETSGGRYLPAGDADALSAAITEAIAPRFGLERLYLDGRIGPVSVIGLDEDIDVVAGGYRLRPLQSATGESIVLNIRDGSAVEVTYDRTLGLLPIGLKP